MKTYTLDQFKGGWFVGDFLPTAYRSREAEVAFKHHHKDEPYPAHRHDVATEINLLVSGRMRMQGVVLEAGTVFVFEPGEVSDPVFLEDCDVVVVKLPSIPGDWYKA